MPALLMAPRLARRKADLSFGAALQAATRDRATPGHASGQDRPPLAARSAAKQQATWLWDGRIIASSPAAVASCPQARSTDGALGVSSAHQDALVIATRQIQQGLWTVARPGKPGDVRPMPSPSPRRRVSPAAWTPRPRGLKHVRSLSGRGLHTVHSPDDGGYPARQGPTRASPRRRDSSPPLG